MIATASSAPRGDGRLWAIALGLSLVANIGILAFAGFASIRSRVFKPPVTAPVAPKETVITIFPAAAPPPAAAAAEPAAKPKFARTSPDQQSAPPDRPAFIGERDTVATSDRAPDASAPLLPSQAGDEPRNPDDLETTRSQYQDGEMAQPESSQATAPAEPAPPVSPAEKIAAAAEVRPAAATRASTLLQGPNPVDVPVPEKRNDAEDIKLTPPAVAAAATRAAALPKPAEDPAFRGNQRKAAIVGSISRSGRSALSVADTPLGRYQATISKAVEQEWQRNCVRHRDFITPGFLSVRFFVEPSGKVKTVQFVGAMETGEVQKGFTLSSIRDAEIPAMSPALKKDYTKEPLELIFNFYF